MHNTSEAACAARLPFCAPMLHPIPSQPCCASFALLLLDAPTPTCERENDFPFGVISDVDATAVAALAATGSGPCASRHCERGVEGRACNGHARKGKAHH
eukprot:203812-Chlamydomonas_euryale.AAC.3